MGQDLILIYLGEIDSGLDGGFIGDLKIQVSAMYANFIEIEVSGHPNFVFFHLSDSVRILFDSFALKSMYKIQTNTLRIRSAGWIGSTLLVGCRVEVLHA